MEDLYSKRGVSTTKSEVHAAIKNIDPGIFPNAFCKILPDNLTGDPDKCNITHADGSGTKSLIAYIHYRETGDASLFKGIAQDSIVMNIDDLLCVGVDTPIIISNTINRNSKTCPQEVIEALIQGSEEFIARLNDYGVEVYSGGGETADVGDLTPTVTVDTTATAVMKRSDVITGDKIREGLVIIGLSSTGQATYEDEENSGIGSNGLTNARHDLLNDYYRRQHPETFNSFIDPDVVYNGKYMIYERPDGLNMSVQQALLSPTRTYAPVIQTILREHPGLIYGLVHCSGGGQTKCMNFGRGIKYVKNGLFPVPQVFSVIQRESGVPWFDMYKVFNMGHRMEIYCRYSQYQHILDIANRFNVEAKVIGITGISLENTNSLEITDPSSGGEYHYHKNF